MVKLNLGCSTRIRPGYINCDWSNDIQGVDVRCDVSKLPFDDDHADVIVASHILEHFYHHQTLDVLKEWRRVLKPDGIIYVATPDIDRAIEIYNKGNLQEWIIYYMYGDQKDKGSFHYNIFNEWRLRKYLENAGFREIIRVEDFPDELDEECLNLVSTIDNKTISLNMMAFK